MRQNGFRRQLANTLQRFPILVAIAYRVYRIFQPKYSVGVVGVLFNEEGHILLVEHIFHPDAPWGLPGGWIGRNEDPASTVQREIKEELDMTVDVGDVLLIETLWRGHIDIAFLCYSKSEVGNLSKELLDFRWQNPAELPPLQKFHYRAINRALEVGQQVKS